MIDYELWLRIGFKLWILHIYFKLFIWRVEFNPHNAPSEYASDFVCHQSNNIQFLNYYFKILVMKRSGAPSWGADRWIRSAPNPRQKPIEIVWSRIWIIITKPARPPPASQTLTHTLSILTSFLNSLVAVRSAPNIC